MALALTDRGLAQTASGSSSTNTVTSGSFSPAAGSLLTVVAYVIKDVAATLVLTLSDTFTGTGTWTEQTTTNIATGSYRMRMSIWTAVAGATPGSGTITVTRTAGTNDQWLVADFTEITGQHATFLGATAAASDLTSSTTFSLTLSSAPASTSLVIGGVADNNGSTPTTPPGSWTELQDVTAPGIGNAYESAYINGSSVTSPQWSGLTADIFGRAGVAIEIIPAAGAFDPTTIQPRWDYSHSALRR